MAERHDCPTKARKVLAGNAFNVDGYNSAKEGIETSDKAFFRNGMRPLSAHRQRCLR